MTVTRRAVASVLLGRFQDFPGGETDAYEVVADALERRARERRAEGRPDVAARLSWLEGRIRARLPSSKKVRDKLRKDLDLITERLCA